MKRICAVIAAILFMIPMPMVASADAEAQALGDINLDGDVNRADVLLLRDWLLGQAAEGEWTNGDLNQDNILNAPDLTLLKRSVLANQSEPEWILEPKGVIHSGEATFYGGGYEGGCAMLDPVSRDYWITAMNLADYNCAQLAGAYLEVTGELGTIHVLVTDLLPEGKKGDLDLYTDAFPLIAPVEKGRVPVTWKIIPLDSAADAPVSYKYKVGSTEFWCAVQVRNHRYPIDKLEYLNDEGEFVALPRRNYNYFEAQSGLGKGPFTFRITDIYGQVVIDRDIPFTPDEIQQGHVQLPE